MTWASFQDRQQHHSKTATCLGHGVDGDHAVDDGNVIKLVMSQPFSADVYGCTLFPGTSIVLLCFSQLCVNPPSGKAKLSLGTYKPARLLGSAPDLVLLKGAT